MNFNYKTQLFDFDDKNSNTIYRPYDDMETYKIENDELQENIIEEEVEYLKHDILHLAKEINKTSKETSQELNQQSEIISKLDPKLNNISENLEKSDTLVRIIRNKLNKFVFWKGKKYPKKTDINTLPSQIEEPEKTSKYSLEELKPNEEYVVDRKTKDDEFFDILINQLRDIQNTNKNIGEELDAQTDALSHMNKKVDTSNKHLDDLNRDINQLIR
jgi:chromosome segregation ATPase